MTHHTGAMLLPQSYISLQLVFEVKPPGFNTHSVSTLRVWVEYVGKRIQNKTSFVHLSKVHLSKNFKRK